MTRTLENQTLLYDANCPLCRVYTKGFIDAGMLDENGKKPYCQLSEEEQNFIDVNRASNEIALVDNQNKTVIYGIDSLLKVIGFSFPWMEQVGNLKPVKFFLKKLYSFISYNRKVIIPSRINREIKLQCVPDFSYKWRFGYIIFAWLVSSLIVFNYLFQIFQGFISFQLITIIIFIQMPFQYLFLMKFDKETNLNYIGNLITISLFGSLILLPMYILKLFFNINSEFNIIYFVLTIFVMIYEHYRRLSVLELPKYLMITWLFFNSLFNWYFLSILNFMNFIH
jgi:hypothetical protein